MSVSAKIICDSISKEGHRLTTFELRYPQFFHTELMTHRMFSRNASSTRAIPTKKFLEEVENEQLRAAPVYWGKNQPGMQSEVEITGDDLIDALADWDAAAMDAAKWARRMSERGIHKQIVNRVLGPYIHINVVVTATEYMNFFGLRLDKAAEPTIRLLAEKMFAEYCNLTPKLLTSGQWHLPYVTEEDLSSTDNFGYTDLIRVSVARCARVSYKSFETGKVSTLEEDLRLYDKLVGAQPIHASPAEHQATPDGWTAEPFRPQRWAHHDEHGNFVGWRQYRKMLPGEAIAPLPKEYQK